MSGHNKWSKIKHKKAGTDAAKSKIFSKMAALISTASRQVKGDVTSPILRAAIDKAREYNMPNDNIERAVKKGLGSEAEAFEQITYEAYGPGGTALIIDALTTNRNKAAQEVKHILSNHGIELAAQGSAKWAFNKTETNEWAPNMEVPIGEEDSKILEALIEELEENDEVQAVYTQTRPRVILAVDPGFDRIGVSVMTLLNTTPIVLFSECIVTKARDGRAKRLEVLGIRVREIIKKWKPTELAIENLFFNQNITSAIGVAEARGVIIYESSCAGLKLHEYAPQSIKVAVTGYGKASKDQVLQMVKKLVDLGKTKRLDDEVDAIALGITHLASTRSI